MMQYPAAAALIAVYSAFQKMRSQFIRSVPSIPRMPCGRISRITISTTSAPTFFRSLALVTSQVQSSTKIPITRLPSSAPNGLPSPPSVIAANISSSSVKPMSQLIPNSRP